MRLVETTRTTKLALVHGDVSPKNILAGPAGPVFLDAECAVYGDPAFDLAFCLNHLLLKCLWRPQWQSRYLNCFTALSESYLEGVAWEPRDAMESRTAALLPGLFLARVDGKSPAEYLTDPADRDRVRRAAKPLIEKAPTRLARIAEAWRGSLA
jgi:thiamine kinase-like enzyme